MSIFTGREGGEVSVGEGTSGESGALLSAPLSMVWAGVATPLTPLTPLGATAGALRTADICCDSL